MFISGFILFLTALGMLTILVGLVAALAALYNRRDTIRELRQENTGLVSLVNQYQTGRIEFDPFAGEHPGQKA